MELPELNKPKSEIWLEYNYCPQKVGFGAFEFYNIDRKSEGYLSLYNKRISINYAYNLSNLKNLRRKILNSNN